MERLVIPCCSQLPLAAHVLVDELARRDNRNDFFRFAAGGFCDFTRIAGSSPEMWRDIALANRNALLGEMDAYVAVLQEIRAAVEAGDGDALLKIFSRARKRVELDE